MSRASPIKRVALKKGRMPYPNMAQKECKGWKPMLHRLGSNNGLAHRWSTSIKIPAQRINVIRIRLSLKKKKAIKTGTKK